MRRSNIWVMDSGLVGGWMMDDGGEEEVCEKTHDMIRMMTMPVIVIEMVRIDGQARAW